MESCYVQLTQSSLSASDSSTHLSARSGLTCALIFLPQTDFHPHLSKWHTLCTWTGRTSPTSSVRSFLNWVFFRMPEGKEAINSEKLCRKFGRIWITNSQLFFIISMMIFSWLHIKVPPPHPLLSSCICTDKLLIASPPFSSAFWKWDGGWICVTLIRNSKIHSHHNSAATHLVQHFPITSSKCSMK